jgi:hypothetical protein
MHSFLFLTQRYCFLANHVFSAGGAAAGAGAGVVAAQQQEARARREAQRQEARAGAGARAATGALGVVAVLVARVAALRMRWSISSRRCGDELLGYVQQCCLLLLLWWGVGSMAWLCCGGDVCYDDDDLQKGLGEAGGVFWSRLPGPLQLGRNSTPQC